MAAAVEAGIAIGLLGEASLVKSLEVLGPDLGFEKTPTSSLVLACSETADAETTYAMKKVIREEFSVSQDRG